MFTFSYGKAKQIIDDGGAPPLILMAMLMTTEQDTQV